MAIPDEKQVYATFGAEIDVNGELSCEWYWPIIIENDEEETPSDN